VSRKNYNKTVQKTKKMRKFFILLFALVFISACGSESTGVNAQAPVKKSLPEPDSVGAKLLKKYCSNCHGVPQPDIHKKNEWRNVVYRMNTRRIKRALGEIPAPDYDALVLYMETYAQ